MKQRISRLGTDSKTNKFNFTVNWKAHAGDFIILVGHDAFSVLVVCRYLEPGSFLVKGQQTGLC